MENFAENTNERLKRVLLQDKLISPAMLSSALKEEIAFILSRYLELKSNVKFKVQIDENGNLDINIYAKASKVQRIK